MFSLLNDVNDEPESQFLYTETIKLYCTDHCKLRSVLRRRRLSWNQDQWRPSDSTGFRLIFDFSVSLSLSFSFSFSFSFSCFFLSLLSFAVFFHWVSSSLMMPALRSIGPVSHCLRLSLETNDEVDSVAGKRKKKSAEKKTVEWEDTNTRQCE